MNSQFVFVGVMALIIAVGTQAFAKDHSQKSETLSCSPFKAIYTPSPAWKRSDGIHYSLTIEDEKCDQTPCVSAKLHLNTYDKDETLLTRLTMHYGCGGTGWVCVVSLPYQLNGGENKTGRIFLDPVALTSDFKRADFLGDNGKPAYALILPALDRALRASPDWDKLKDSIEVFTDRKLPLELAVRLNTSEVWLLTKCNK